MSEPNDAFPGAAAPETPAPILAERRAALAKLGLLAVWTTPTITPLLVPRRSEAAESQPGEPGWP